jgi:type I restriction enzyme S subunit
MSEAKNDIIKVLPQGWKWEKIINLIGNDGLYADGDWIESKDQDINGEIRLIQLADIGDGVFLDKSDRYINKETAKRLRCTFLKKGDILVARMPDPLGRCCVFPLRKMKNILLL